MKTNAFGKDYLPVVDFPISGKYRSKDIAQIDLSHKNETLRSVEELDVHTLGQIVDAQIEAQGAKIGIGGYGERRKVYEKFKLFGKPSEPREIHLGIDIWAPKKTPVVAVLPGKIHSMAHNDNPGDYGPTIILEHMLGNTLFYSLYGHLTKKSLTMHKVGTVVPRGTVIGKIGSDKNNGGWPPHLHFQLINNMENAVGDYPGVCMKKDAHRYLKNCPDPYELFAHSWKSQRPKK